MSVQNLFDALLHNCTLGPMRLLHTTQALTGNITLTKESPTLQILDPGAARTVTLPAEADSIGLVFIIVNTGVATEIITINDDAAATKASLLGVATADDKEMAVLVCDGVQWIALVGAST